MSEYFNLSQSQLYKYFRIFAELYLWLYPVTSEINRENKYIKLKVHLDENGKCIAEEEVLFSSNESYKIKRLKFTAHPFPSENSEIVTFIVIPYEITEILVAFEKQTLHYTLFDKYYEITTE